MQLCIYGLTDKNFTPVTRKLYIKRFYDKHYLKISLRAACFFFSFPENFLLTVL